MTVTELLSFKASPAYLASNALFKEKLPEIKGLISYRHGIQVEDEVTAYAFFEWETLQDHKNFENDKPLYEPLVGQLRLAMESPPQMLHVEFTPSPANAMSAPVTAVVHNTLKEGKSKEEFATLVNMLSNAEGAKGAYPPLAWGPTVENEANFVQLVGWESIEAHTEALQAKTDIKLLLSELADTKLSHVRFRH